MTRADSDAYPVAPSLPGDPPMKFTSHGAHMLSLGFMSQATLFLPIPAMPLWVAALMGIVCAVAAAFLNQPPVQQWVFWAVVADLVTGVLCGVYKRGGLRASSLMLGWYKKCLILILVFAFHQMDWHVDIAGAKIGIGTAVGLWYIGLEALSIAENLSELGVPLPPFVLEKLAKSRESMGYYKQPPRPFNEKYAKEENEMWDRLIARTNPRKVSDEQAGAGVEPPSKR